MRVEGTDVSIDEKLEQPRGRGWAEGARTQPGTPSAGEGRGARGAAVTISTLIETPREAARRFMDSLLDLGFTERAIFTYTHPDGAPWFWRLRAKNPETWKRWGRPMHKNGNGFELGEPPELTAPGAMRPLYARLLDEPSPVWILQGEPAVLALERLGLPAATSGSPTSAGGADWSPVTSRPCREAILFPDNDTTSRTYADEVASILLGQGFSLEAIDVEALDLPADRDVMDWLKAHPEAKRADLEALPRTKVGRKPANETDEAAGARKVQADDLPATDPVEALPEPVDGAEPARLPLEEADKVRIRVGEVMRRKPASAALTLSGAVPDGDPVKMDLLRDASAAFDELGRDRVSSAKLIACLTRAPGSRWAAFHHGTPISPRRLARLLSGFGIVPTTVRLPDGSTAKGYKREAFADALARRIPTENPSQRHQPAPMREVTDSAIRHIANRHSRFAQGSPVEAPSVTDQRPCGR